MPLTVYEPRILKTEKKMSASPVSQKVMKYYTWMSHRPYMLKDIVKHDCEVIDKLHNVHKSGIDKIVDYANHIAEVYQDVFVTDYFTDDSGKKATTYWIRIKNEDGMYIGGKDEFVFDNDECIVQVETALDEQSTQYFNDVIDFGL
jgi:hypothetical protein